MDNDISFFELKYLITDSFYFEILKNSRTYGQAYGICYESFYGYIVSDGIYSAVAIFSIMLLAIRHNVELSDNNIKLIKTALNKVKSLDIENTLNSAEREYLEDDIQSLNFYLKDKLNNY